jgi:uncharacterized membrane protein
MKDLKSLFSKDFVEQRYHYHSIGGIILGILGFLITFEAGSDFGRMLLTNVLVFIGAVGWELARGLLYNYQMDWADVRFSCYGGLIGSIIACLIL